MMNRNEMIEALRGHCWNRKTCENCVFFKEEGSWCDRNYDEMDDEFLKEQLDMITTKKEVERVAAVAEKVGRLMDYCEYREGCDGCVLNDKYTDCCDFRQMAEEELDERLALVAETQVEDPHRPPLWDWLRKMEYNEYHAFLTFLDVCDLNEMMDMFSLAELEDRRAEFEESRKVVTGIIKLGEDELEIGVPAAEVDEFKKLVLKWKKM